ncbi:hypothetical protein EMIHUDRAFT_351345 [Emiliania huxleyi CCMP1516]|uniref:Uncharacterized protein n=2 Tax=Emiliania huxleyi TaxID=2903 RepID=A0A0D3L048_EMIH1|nr:hypothetical protein EMIHUDRAFT_351345 [Emiliania huxleyi CCMP1516]EOD41383.1 hypothetical protein EMIHUDRAFT_351345 [Emiliania huxleyi CCMP1516]|eukprot:XP_005793812.1 hypothetical protein EMIHUDRAFT_351345 [Emiliania huxleyi CCMP1516]
MIMVAWLDTVKPGFGDAYGSVFAEMGCDEKSDLQFFDADALRKCKEMLTAAAGKKMYVDTPKIMNAIKAVLEKKTPKAPPKPKPAAQKRPRPNQPDETPVRGRGGGGRGVGSSSSGRGRDAGSSSSGSCGGSPCLTKGRMTRNGQEGVREQILAAFIAAQEAKNLDGMVLAKEKLKRFLEEYSKHEQDQFMLGQLEEAIREHEQQ